MGRPHANLLPFCCYILQVQPPSATVGSFTLTITGTSGSLSHTTTLGLTVNPPPGNPDFSIGASPVSVSLNQGASANASITITSLNGFNSSTSLSVSGAPSGVTGTFAPASVTPAAGSSASSTLTLAASSSATTGTFTLTVTGTSGTHQHSTTLTLQVTASNAPLAITSISPTDVFSGGPDFTLTINGSGFVNGSVVDLGIGNSFVIRNATFVSSTQLTVQMTSSDIATPGTISISVLNPSPGGGFSGTSNQVTLNVD